MRLAGTIATITTAATFLAACSGPEGPPVLVPQPAPDAPAPWAVPPLVEPAEALPTAAPTPWGGVPTGPPVEWLTQGALDETQRAATPAFGDGTPATLVPSGTVLPETPWPTPLWATPEWQVDPRDIILRSGPSSGGPLPEGRAGMGPPDDDEGLIRPDDPTWAPLVRQLLETGVSAIFDKETGKWTVLYGPSDVPLGETQVGTVALPGYDTVKELSVLGNAVNEADVQGLLRWMIQHGYSHYGYAKVKGLDGDLPLLKIEYRTVQPNEAIAALRTGLDTRQIIAEELYPKLFEKLYFQFLTQKMLVEGVTDPAVLIQAEEYAAKILKQTGLIFYGSGSQGLIGPESDFDFLVQWPDEPIDQDAARAAGLYGVPYDPDEFRTILGETLAGTTVARDIGGRIRAETDIEDLPFIAQIGVAGVYIDNDGKQVILPITIVYQQEE